MLLLRKATLAMFRQIADFMICGTGQWYDMEDDGSIIFFDGPEDAAAEDSRLFHFR